MSGKRFMGRWWSARLVVAALAGVQQSAWAVSSVDTFDFSYRISGDRAARPVQVFDDGDSKTYFQFPAGAPVPLILARHGPDAIVPAVEGPYHTVSGRALAYTLVLAGHTARVEHATLAPEAANLPAGPGRSGTAPPADRTLSSYATPIRGDIIEWIEPEQQASHELAFVGQTARLSPGSRDAVMTTSKRLGAQAHALILVFGQDSRDALMRKRVAQVRQTLVDSGMAARHIQVEGPTGSEQRGWRAASAISVQWRAPGQRQKTPTPVPAREGAAEPSVSMQPVPRTVDVVAADRPGQ